MALKLIEIEDMRLNNYTRMVAE